MNSFESLIVVLAEFMQLSSINILLDQLLYCTVCAQIYYGIFPSVVRNANLIEICIIPSKIAKIFNSLSKLLF